MKIALNLLFVIPGKVGGTQTYAEGLLSELDKNSDHEFIILCSKDYYNSLIHKFPNLHYHIVSLVQFSRPLRFLIEFIYLPFFALQHKIDIIHSLGYTCPFFLPCANIVTIHDLNWYYHPENFSKLNRFFWKCFVTISAKYSDHIITSSNRSKVSISKVLKIPSGKIADIYGGIWPRKSSTDTKKSYLLTVTSLVPHKNVMRLLQAYKLALQKGFDRNLYIVGLKGKDEHQVSNYINKNLKSRVKIFGWVSDKKLDALYKNAEVFIFASTYEGFGFPVLEAMSYSLPVISSEAYSLKEIIAENAFPIDPYSIESMANAMITVTKDEKLKKELANKGKLHVKSFTWAETFRKHLIIYEKNT